jgi:hypothetical protein
MALTLTEGNKYSATTLRGYVIDRLGKSDSVLARVPFEEIQGNSLTYNTITTRSAAAAFRQVGDTWTESTPVVTAATAALTILGADADIDNFIAKTRSNILDVKGTVLNDAILSIKEKFMDAFFYGSGTAPEFTGLHGLMTSTTYNTVLAGSSTGTALSMLKLQTAIDLVQGKPQLIASSKSIRRYVNVYLDSVGTAFTATRDQFGNMVEYYRGIPWDTSDYILNTETCASGAYTAKTGSGNTSIFILTFDGKACCGIQNGQVAVDPLGNLETKDAQRYRIKWYCGLKLEDLRSCAKVDGIDADGTVTA